MSPSRLWPWRGLLRHLCAECGWMGTFPGSSLIDAPVDARGLMHFGSPLAFTADPRVISSLAHTEGVRAFHRRLDVTKLL